MTLSPEAQAWEQEKEYRIWWAIANDHVRNLQQEIVEVLRPR